LNLEIKRVLITVKAPPNPSKKHQETNCCTGVDLDSGQMVRLYPIPFRLLDYSKKFRKYSIIKVKCARPVRDKRIESYRIDQDSIEIQRTLDTEDGWAERKSIVLPTLAPSFCKIIEDIKIHKSLGLFKLTEIEFEHKKSVPQDEKKRQAAYNQHTLFDRKLTPPEQIPFSFYYKFKCYNHPACTGHKLMIHDWELTEAYRCWSQKYERQQDLLDKIRETWLGKLCSPKRDVYFFVGNVWRRPKQFMVLGVFYPPKSESTLF